MLVIVKDGQVLTETGKQDILDAGPEAYKKWMALSSKTAGEPAVAKKEKGSNEPKVAAAKLPPPSDGEYPANEIGSARLELADKIIKVKFNRIYYMVNMGKGMYAGDLRSWVKLQGDTYTDREGIQIRFPQEGLGFFSKYIFNPGVGYEEWGGLMSSSDRATVYIQVGKTRKAGCVAVGDRYKKNGDEGEYEWSTETQIPDLTSQRKISVNDVWLFSDQLNGKTVELEFYEVGAIEPRTTGKFSASISSGRGHAFLSIDFPPEGKAFFKDILDQNKNPKANTVYAVVTVSPAGVITLEAKGRRASESGGELIYKW